jgi:hypothetical protein
VITHEQSSRVFRLLKYPGAGPRIAARTPDERDLLAGFRSVCPDARLVVLRVLAVFVKQEQEPAAGPVKPATQSRTVKMPEAMMKGGAS